MFRLGVGAHCETLGCRGSIFQADLECREKGPAFAFVPEGLRAHRPGWSTTQTALRSVARTASCSAGAARILLKGCGGSEVLRQGEVVHSGHRRTADDASGKPLRACCPLLAYVWGGGGAWPAMACDGRGRLAGPPTDHSPAARDSRSSAAAGGRIGLTGGVNAHHPMHKQSQAVVSPKAARVYAMYPRRGS